MAEDTELERLRAFALTAGDWLWETDAELRFSWLSDSVGDSVERMLAFAVGRRRDEFVDMSFVAPSDFFAGPAALSPASSEIEFQAPQLSQRPDHFL